MQLFFIGISLIWNFFMFIALFCICKDKRCSNHFWGFLCCSWLKFWTSLTFLHIYIHTYNHTCMHAYILLDLNMKCVCARACMRPCACVCEPLVRDCYMEFAPQAWSLNYWFTGLIMLPKIPAFMFFAQFEPCCKCLNVYRLCNTLF